MNKVLNYKYILFSLILALVPVLDTFAQYDRRTPVVEAVQKVLPSVVNISTEKEITELVRVSPFRSPFGTPFDRTFERNYQVEGLGSGVLVEGGYIITNNHVIDSDYGQPDKIYITFHKDDKRYEARVIGMDPASDVSILKLSEEINRPGLSWGRSNDLMIGETVIAIGNALGQPFTVTNGIISALNRTIDVDSTSSLTNLIQTNADINRGNSGGPLVNINGDFIGLNTAIISPSGGSIGLGFAIPVDRVKNIFDYWVNDTITLQDRLDLNVQDMSPPLKQYYLSYYPELDESSVSGVVVTDVAPTSIASDELTKRDIITKVQNRKIDSESNFYRTLNDITEDKIELAVIREGKPVTISLNVPDQKIETFNWAGLELQELDSPWRRRLGLPPKYTGLIVREVQPGSAADKKGIKRGDWIDGINQQQVKTLEDIKSIYQNVNLRSLNLDVLRYEKKQMARSWQDNWKRMNFQLEVVPTL